MKFLGKDVVPNGTAHTINMSTGFSSPLLSTEARVPCADCTTEVHGSIVDGSDYRDILLGNKSLNRHLSSSLVECTPYTNERLRSNKGGFVGTSSVLIHKVDLKSLAENTKRYANVDVGLAVLVYFINRPTTTDAIWNATRRALLEGVSRKLVWDHSARLTQCELNGLEKIHPQPASS